MNRAKNFLHGNASKPCKIEVLLNKIIYNYSNIKKFGPCYRPGGAVSVLEDVKREK